MVIIFSFAEVAAKRLPRITQNAETPAVTIPIIAAGSHTEFLLNAKLAPIANASKLVAIAGKKRFPAEKNSPNGQVSPDLFLQNASYIILPPTEVNNPQAR